MTHNFGIASTGHTRSMMCPPYDTIQGLTRLETTQHLVYGTFLAQRQSPPLLRQGRHLSQIFR